MKLNRSVISKILLIILIAASVLALFINKGLYYFELNNHVEVEVDGDINEVNNFVNSLNNTNLIRVDKINYLLTFENLSESDVRNYLNNLNSEGKVTLQYASQYFERNSILKNHMLVVALLVIASFALFLYFLLRNKSTMSYRKVVYLVGSYLIIALLSNLILSGIVSILSRFYQVRELDLVSFLIMNLWLSIIFFTALWRINVEDFDKVSTLYASEEFYHKNYILLALLILVVITIGLGFNFLVTAALVFIGFLLTSFNFYNIGSILTFGFKIQRPQINIKRPSLNRFRKKEPEIIQTPTPDTFEKEKKKNKKKKRK